MKEAGAGLWILDWIFGFGFGSCIFGFEVDPPLDLKLTLGSPRFNN
jgi:hypothetical protein